MYPLKLSPILKDAIWGGNILSNNFGFGQKNQQIAEAWMLTLRDDGENLIEQGAFSGKSIREFLPKEHFPLLIKLIDANDKLSVQVHPDDNYAKNLGLPAGKTEMWYVLDAKPDSKLVYGFKNGYIPTAKELKQFAINGELEQHLNYVNVKKGDVFFLPSGLVHAIGEGILVAEVQQNSNTTFRLYDYNRTDKNGKKRQLHIDEAVSVIVSTQIKSTNTKKDIFVSLEKSLSLLCECEYFSVFSLKLNHSSHIISPSKYTFLMCVDGDGAIEYNDKEYPFKKGDGYLILEELGSVKAKSDGCELLICNS